MWAITLLSNPCETHIKIWKVRWNSIKPSRFSSSCKILQFFFSPSSYMFSILHKCFRTGQREAPIWVNHYLLRKEAIFRYRMYQRYIQLTGPLSSFKYIKYVLFVLLFFENKLAGKTVYLFLISLAQKGGSNPLSQISIWCTNECDRLRIRGKSLWETRTHSLLKYRLQPAAVKLN